MGAAKTGRTYNTQTPGAAPPVDESVVSIAGMSSDDTTIEIAGKQFPLNEVVQAAFETSGSACSNGTPSSRRSATRCCRRRCRNSPN
jgi:hypothetical protein